MERDLADIASHLAATDVFGLLEPPALLDLASLFGAERFAPGQMVARQGQIDADLWVVTSGQLSVEAREPDGRSVHVATRGYGSVVGLHGVFLGAPRASSVVAMSPATLLCAEGDGLWARLQARPELLDRMILPDDVRAALSLQPGRGAVVGERTVGVFRRHWLVLLRGLLLPVGLLVGLSVGAMLVAPMLASAPAILLLALVALGVPLAATAWAFLDYYQDCLIVTNRRVVHVERTPLIDARRRETPLARIQDVQVVRPGMAARLFRFGDISVQTAGTHGALALSTMADPERVRAIIFEQIEQGRALDRSQQRAWVARQLRSALGSTDGPDDRDESPTVTPVFDDLGGGVLTRLAATIVALLTLPLPKMRLEQGEVVTWRKHWWVLVRRTALFALSTLLLAAALVVALVAPYRGGPPLSDRPVPAVVIGILFAVSAFLLWWRFEDWRNDVYQLTDEHLIDVERRPLGFYENRRQARLAQVQDIRFDVPNPLAKLLGYGHVEIETAAELGSFTFDFVYRPEDVQQEIFERIDQDRARRETEERDRRAEEMRLWLSEYHRLTSSDAGAGEVPLAPA